MDFKNSYFDPLVLMLSLKWSSLAEMLIKNHLTLCRRVVYIRSRSLCTGTSTGMHAPQVNHCFLTRLASLAPPLFITLSRSSWDAFSRILLRAAQAERGDRSVTGQFLMLIS